MYEFDEYVLIEVQAQSCCPGGQGQVDFFTSDITAVAGRDYVHTAGTLILAGGTKTHIRVPLIDDVLVEERKQFQVTLTNFRGTFAERGSDKAVVNILDDDWSYSEPLPAIGESEPASPPKPPALVPGNPGPATAIETVPKSNEVSGDGVVAPPLEAAPAAPARKDEKGRTSSSNAAFLLIVFLTVSALAYGFRR